MNAVGRVARFDGSLCVSEARILLEHPVFGDERCIEARDILRLAESVSEARRELRDGFHEPRTLGGSPLPEVASMNAAELENELEMWESLRAIEVCS